MQHHSLLQWEKQLKSLLDDLDDYLEDKFGSLFKLHPSRPDRGETSNKSHDGLFDIVGKFSLGIGTREGRGYNIDIHTATLDSIPAEKKEHILNTAFAYLKNRISEYFPGKDIHIKKTDSMIRLYGDLSLGNK